MHLEQNPSQKPTKINNKGAVNSSMSWGFNSLRRSNQQEKKNKKTPVIYHTANVPR